MISQPGGSLKFAAGWRTNIRTVSGLSKGLYSYNLEVLEGSKILSVAFDKEKSFLVVFLLKRLYQEMHHAADKRLSM
jgi:hypothetical protein